MTNTTTHSITDELLCLADFLDEVRKHTGQEVSYYRGQKLVLDGKIPAKRQGRKCLLRRSDVPTAAKALGLTRQTAA
jgi:hypothetical protein